MSGLRIDEILQHFQGVKQLGRNHYKVLCPCHDDHKPSLDICEKDGKILMACPVCEADGRRVMDTLNLPVKELFAEQRRSERGEKPPGVDYHYTDSLKKSRYYVWNDKKQAYKKCFCWYHKRGAEWVKGLPKENGRSISPPLYKQNNIEWAKQRGKVLYLVEGEKDVDTLTKKLRLPAVCSPHGAATAKNPAKKWDSAYNALFSGADVAVIPDNDEGYLETLYNRKQYENAQKQWTDTYALLKQQEEQYNKFAREAAAASDKYMAAVEENDGFATVWDYQEYQDFWNRQIEYTNEAGEAVKGTFRDAFEESKKNIKDMEAACDGYLETMKDISDEGNKVAESSKTWQSAASEAIQSVQSQIDNLAAAYDEAFEAAQKSIQNTVGLTTELSNETEITTGKLTETWENQIEWINKYSENLQKAQQYGITEGLITSLSDGSQESGQYINQIIGELDNLNAQDAKALVDKLNKDFNGVQAAEGSFAKTVAGYKTHFEKSMNDMQTTAEKAIAALDLSEDAKKSAAATIQAYVGEINKQISNANFINATSAVQAAVKSSLTPKGIFAYSQMPDIETNARGTKHSADVFLAGEEGPELIINAEGSQVFTAAETQRILSGEADGTAEQYAFDLPELVRQLAESTENPGTTFTERANALDSGGFDNYSSSSVNHISYSPTYQINGNSNEAIMDGVRRADKMSKSEFAKMMREYESDVKRTSFK